MPSPQICQCVTSPQVISDSITGEILCRNCGVVLESHTIGYSDTIEKNTTSRHDYGIGTAPAIIKLSHRSSQRIAQRVTSKDKRTKELFMEITPILQKISATNAIKEEAYNIARKCIKQHLVRGRRKIDVAAACVIVSCKVHGKAMPESEIIKIANASKKTTRKTCRIILHTFGVNTITIQQRTIKLVNRICSDLGISQRIMIRSLELLEKIKQNDTSVSSNPGTIAGTVVYLSCEGKISQRKIANISGVTDVSLRNFSKKIDGKNLE